MKKLNLQRQDFWAWLCSGGRTSLSDATSLAQRLLLFLAILVTGVNSAWAEDYTLGYPNVTTDSKNLQDSPTNSSATFIVNEKTFTITNTSTKTLQTSNFTPSGGSKTYGVKYAKNTTFTVNVPSNLSVTSVTFGGWSNDANNSAYIAKINGEDIAQGTSENAGSNYFNTKQSYRTFKYDFASVQTNNFTFTVGSSEIILNITLTASTLQSYTITFDANNGSGTMPSQVITGTAALNNNTFTAPASNSFVGWNTAADGTGTDYTQGQSVTPTGDMTLYAQWMRFNSMGGENPKTVNVGSNQNHTLIFTSTKDLGLSASNFSASSANEDIATVSVNGAYLNNRQVINVTGKKAGVVDITVQLTGVDGTLYENAQVVVPFTVNATINYNTNGGDAIAADVKSAAYDLPTPTKTSSTFAGWYSDEELTQAVASPYTPTVNTTLYAKWIETASIGSIKTVEGTTTTWNFADITADQMNSMKGATMGTWVADGDKAVKNPAVDAAVYWSPTWCEGIELGLNQKAENTKARIYASDGGYPGFWLGGAAASMKVTIPAGANTLTVKSKTGIEARINGSNTATAFVNDGEVYTLAVAENDVIEIRRVSGQGSNSIYFVQTSYVAPATFTVSFNVDSKGGNVAQRQEANPGEGVTLPAMTPIAGYTFLGWDENGDGIVDAHAGDNYKPTRDIELTAVYRNGNTIGDASCGWWTAFSEFKPLLKDNSIRFTFNNKTYGTDAWHNWVMIVTNDGKGHNGDGQQEDSGNELYLVRSDLYAWSFTHTGEIRKDAGNGQYNKVVDLTNSADKAEFMSAMANAMVDIQISFDGNYVYTIAKIVGADDEKYVFKDKSTTSLGNLDQVYVSFTTEKATMTFIGQDTNTPSVRVNVSANDSNYGDVAAKIVPGIMLESERPIWAGTEVVFQAVPKGGYILENWTDSNHSHDVVSAETDFIKVITENANYKANFARSYGFTVNAVDASSNVLQEIKTGTAVAGTNTTVYYPAFILKDGVMYKINNNPNHPDYGSTFEVDGDDKVVNITYTAQDDIQNVVAYFEGEGLPGASSITSTDMSSNGALGRYAGSNDYHQIMTLNQGKYKIYGYARNANGSNYDYSFTAASTEVFTGTIFNKNNYQSLESEEFIVENDNTPLSLNFAGGSASGIDFLYIVRTGDYAPVQDNKVNITFTTEEGQAVAVVSTPNYGVTASVADGNMTTDGTALKMETSTTVTFTIPEGYTATMTMKASNNGGIKVDGTSMSTTNTWTNLAAGTHTITKGNSLNVSMITIELSATHENAALKSVTTTVTGAEVTPAGNNIWGVVLPYTYNESTVPVTLTYENADAITVKLGDANQIATATGDHSATYNFNIGTQTEPVSYTVMVESKEYTINVLKLGQEFEKIVRVTDFNYYIGTSGISANDNGLDRDLNGVTFTFGGGQGVKANSESNLTVRTRSDVPGEVTITLTGDNSTKNITKVVLVGSGFTAEAANYLTMDDGQITFRNSNELMVVPTTQTNTVTFLSNGTDVNFTSFKIYTDAVLSFTKVTPTIAVSVPAHVVTTSTLTPTLTTTPRNFKVNWTLTNGGSKSVINGQTGVVEVGGVKEKTETITATFAGNDFYAAANGSASFTTAILSVKSISATGFEEAKTEPGQEISVSIETDPEEAICYYTTDGSDPATSGTRQTGKSLNITQSTLVKAVAVMTVGDVEMVSDMASMSFNYKDPKLFNTVAVTELNKITDATSRSNDYMPDQILKDGGGNDACILSWGSYRYCGLDGSIYSTAKRGDFHTLKGEPAKVQNVDGFGRVLDAQNNPKAEDGTNYSMADALDNDPLNLPVMGSFAKLQPLYNGTATVYILQNGASDWVYEKVAGKDVETYQLNKLRRRPTYVVDEFGTALSNGANGEPEVVHAELASNAVFETKTFNAIQLAVAGTTDNAFDENTKVSTISESNGAANVAYWHNLINTRNWAAGGNMPSSGANSALVRTEANGFELMIKQYVKYTFPVTAGRTYFVLGSGTNNGLAAAKFERSNNDVSSTEAAIDIDEAATDCNNITSNIGKQKNVCLKRVFEAGKWYSLVLPFSMNEAQVKEHFGECAIYWFDSSDNEGNIHWKKHHYQMINAGIPVLIKVGRNFNNGIIKNVLIQTDKIRQINFGGDYAMVGTWTKTSMPENCYYISNTASSNPGSDKVYNATFYRTTKETSTKGLRAWVTPLTSTAAKLTGISFTSFMEEAADAPTAIEEVLEGTDEIVTPALGNGAIYNVNGQQVNANSFRNLGSGIYIQNGKKFIK